MEANQLKPAHFKPLPEKYILTDKLFCGHCGEKMAGESGTSKTGKTHRYYNCVSAKRKRGCNKKAVNKAFIEGLVLEHTMKLLRDDKLISRIVDNVFELQKRTNTSLAPLQNQLKQAEKEIHNILSAIKAGIITKSTKSELEKLEAEKESLETKIAKEQIERPTLTKQQIKFWICKFRDTDLADESQKQKLIDTFVNSVYVYDDKMVLTFNHKDGERLVDFAEVENAKVEPSRESSTFDGFAHMV